MCSVLVELTVCFALYWREDEVESTSQGIRKEVSHTDFCSVLAEQFNGGWSNLFSICWSRFLLSVTSFLHSTCSPSVSRIDEYRLWIPVWTIPTSKSFGRWGLTSCSLCLQEWTQQHTNYTGILKVGNMFGDVFDYNVNILNSLPHHSQQTGKTMCFVSYVSKRWHICTNSDCFGPFFPETETEIEVIELYVIRASFKIELSLWL